MMAETVKVMEPGKKAAPAAMPKLLPPGELMERVQKMYDTVARRAFEMFEQNGGIFGKDWDNWFRAEGELLRPVLVDMAEKGDELTIRAEVPGFKAGDLQVSLEGRRLTISGRRETKRDRKDEKVLYREHRSDQVMRVVDLPMEVNTQMVAATLKDGVLELKMPKVAGPKKVAITPKKG